MNYGPRWATNWHREFFSEVAASDIRPVIEDGAIVMPALCQRQMLKAPTRPICAPGLSHHLRLTKVQ
jgi:hypothetical protein